MNNDTVTVFVSGKIYWCKLLPQQAVKNYDGDGTEWTCEFEPDDTTFLKENKLLDRLKDVKDRINKLERVGEEEKAEKLRSQYEDRKGIYLNLRKNTVTRDGKKSDPVRIYDAQDEKWDNDVEIGNGTSVDMKLNIRHWGKGKKSSIYMAAVRVTDLVEYERKEGSGTEFGAMGPAKAGGNQPIAKKAPTPKKNEVPSDFEMDDDIPF